MAPKATGWNSTTTANSSPRGQSGRPTTTATCGSARCTLPRGRGQLAVPHTRSDDIAGIWVDIDGDGVLELSGAFGDTGGGNNQKGELISYEDDNDWKTVALAAGDHLIAFTHREGTGGSTAEFQIKSPTMTAGQIVKPTSPQQTAFYPLSAFSNGVVKSGTGTLTFNAPIPTTARQRSGRCPGGGQ